MAHETASRYDFSEEVDLAHPLSLRRVPVVQSPHLRFKYHVAVVIGPETWDWVPPGEEPTQREADQLVAYLDFRLRWYNGRHRAHMLESHPFDLDSGINTYTFKKSPEVGWQYNAATWTMHTWFPQNRMHDERFDSLEALLDYVQNLVPEKWAAFKAERPDLWSEVI
jgi:hypothetical protein